MDLDLPSGTVTFLFTDIEGSTRLWEQHPESMKAALARHDAILRTAIETHQGHIVKTTGDGCHAVFETAAQGVSAAFQAQGDLADEAWETIQPQVLRVRMGLHTGEAEARGGDYYGSSLNRAARLMSIGHGGQILISATTADVVRDQLPPETALLDLGEHRLKDLIRPERVYQLTHLSLAREFPALRSLDAYPNNLPIQLTSFVGRERELVEARQRLGTARLLTLIGPGGTGKTRLGLQLAAEMLSAFSDGVWLVELAPLADPALVLQTVASVFNIHEQMGMPLGDLVFNYLRAKQLLIVLDNCEHLVEACAKLADQLLHACPNLKIIASSREALGITGEAVYRVPSLSLPEADQVSVEALSLCEAAQLFIERARAANPKFELTEKNCAAVAQICRRLDGIPLALELAAARMSLFSVEQIASRLDDRFKLLTGGSRTALPRQQTLRALIDWSYDMLAEPERALLRRLAVFSGGWTFESAEMVFPDLDVLDLLSHLANKSMVAVDDGDGETRYRLLETVRQYARDKLLEAGESAAMRNLHLDYFTQLAEVAESNLFGKDALEWIVKLEAEYDNLRAAMEWGLENNIDATLRIVGALPNFWFRRGQEMEGLHWANEAVARAEAAPIPEGKAGRDRVSLLAKAWNSVAMLTYSQGDNNRAILATEAATKFARQLGEKGLLSAALSFQASAKMFLGEVEGVEELLNESLAAAEEVSDKFGLGMAMGLIGSRLAMIKRDFKAAHDYSERATALLRESGNQWGFTMSLLGLGMTAKFLGDYGEARKQFTACLPMFREVGDKHRVNMCQSELAHLERYEGHYEQALGIYRQTILEWQRLGHRAAIAHQLECFAQIAKVQEQEQRAARLFGAAEALREKIEIPMTAVERVEYDREVADLRSNMDEKAFTALRAEGRLMTMEQAISYALEPA